MLQFTTVGFTILTAMKLLGATSIANIRVPENLKDDNVRRQWLRRLACRIVDHVFLPPDELDIRQTARHFEIIQSAGHDRASFPYCICHRGIHDII